MVGFTFAPRGWAMCNGQILAINQNTALFSLLGTTYGGNGQTTFALPDLRGRVPVHLGQGPGLSNYTQGEVVGTESVTLITNQIPAHAHSVLTSKDEETTNRPDGAYPTVGGIYANTQNGAAPMAPSSSAGGSQPHANLQPLLVINFVIATEGIFPSRN
jgi:microcystin-dependent protein